MQKAIEEIDTVVDNTVEMAKMTSSMIERSIKALADNDVKLAEDVMADFEKVDKYDRCIEESALRVLSLYQPRASDMRTMATVLKCITYLERVSKYSKNISQTVGKLSGAVPDAIISDIVSMGDVAVNMVNRAINGFIARSVDSFDEIQDMDDQIDGALARIRDELIAYIKENPSSADDCAYLLSIIRYIERVGDHACKIAEKVTYMVTGFHTVIA